MFTTLRRVMVAWWHEVAAVVDVDLDVASVTEQPK